MDLALLSPASRLFRSIYLDARTAEEAWLDELAAASEAVGIRVIDLICKCLFAAPSEVLGDATMAFLDITEEAINPPPPDTLTLLEDGGKFFLRAPAWGLQEGGQKLKVSWFHYADSRRRFLLCNNPINDFQLALWCVDGHVCVFRLDLGNRSPAIILGFLHRVLQAEALQVIRAGPERGDLRLHVPSALLRQGLSNRCNNAVEGGGELQRAISALLMRHWPRWRVQVIPLAQV